MMEPLLYSAHFQLTGRCNLRCRFCGQSRGMLGAAGTELPVEFWLRVASEVKALSAAATPEITLWGGEPLLYDGFARLAENLSGSGGFRLGIVTNGTRMDRYPEVLCECIDAIYISIDGMGPMHDMVRGAGQFERIRKNLHLLRHRKGKLVFLTTVSDTNVTAIADLPEQLAELGPDEIVLQQLMYLTQNEIDIYRKFSLDNFDCDYPELEAWRRDDDKAYLAELKRQLAKIRTRRYPIPVRFTPHRYPEYPSAASECESPFRRVHIRYDGAVGFCTDYFGFVAGNLQTEGLAEIFYGKRTECFRDAVRNRRLPICDHCPWRRQKRGSSADCAENKRSCE